jgi:integrase
MVVVEEKGRAAPQNNWKPETSSLLLGSGPELPAAPASSNTTTTTAPAPRCPECGSQKTWKDGLRYTFYGEIQRYICRNCSYRFSHSERSEPFEPNQKVHRQILNCGSAIPSSRQVCVSQTKAMINLAEVESRTQEKAAGATPKTRPSEETTRGLIAQYAYWLEKEAHTVPTYLNQLKRLAKKGANLLDPEDVKSVIAKQQTWNKSTKMLTSYAYDSFAKMLGIQWTQPIYKQDEVLPFIPTEAELDQLIAASQSKRMAAFLQALKETFADPGEAIRLRWIDVDPANNTITINQPVKGHNSRQLQVSSKVIAMIMALPKSQERIFPMNYNAMNSNYFQFRKRVAQKLQNPRIRQISFNTFRHWGATMTYHYTRKILLVQKILGHKRIESTMRYTRLVQFKDNEFDVEAAQTVEEAKDLLKIGFDFITEKNGFMLFRRPKRFGPALGVPIDP